MATPPRGNPRQGSSARGQAARRGGTRTPPRTRTRTRWQRFRLVVVWSLRLLLYGALFLAGMWAGLVTAAVPELDQLEQSSEFSRVEGVVLARDGRTVLRKLRGEGSRRYAEEKDIPPVLFDAVVAAEDRRFREHNGIDIEGIGRAAVVDIRTRELREGGSTITQQLVKNAYLGPDRSFGRKTREALVAVALENRWSKERIMAAYLNTAYFGNGEYGIVEASRGYFGVRPAKLKAHQAALLAALLRAPERDNPLASPIAAKTERDRVLRTMGELDLLRPPDVTAAQAKPVPTRKTIAANAKTDPGEIAPHAVDAVLAELIDRYGTRRTLGGGLRVKTTIDARMQRNANAAMERITGTGLSAAIVAVDTKSGELRAMSIGGPARDETFNVAMSGLRQPGSAFKPFMLAAAYEHGYAPGTAVRSAEFEEEYPGIGPFTVTNGGGYAGITTLEHGTWTSDNTVYARLQHQLGIEPAIRVARAAGISSRMDPYPSLVLGALPEGASPVEMASAYGAIGNHGQLVEQQSMGRPALIDSVSMPDVGRRWHPSSVTTRAVPREVADMVTDTLQGTIREGTATNAAIDRPAAGKTGTTEEYKDAWFVGYVPGLSVAVWVGHADAGRPMRTEYFGGPVMGGTFPALIWHDFMAETLATTPERDFDLQIPRFETAYIDVDSGRLAPEECTVRTASQYVEGRAPAREVDECPRRPTALPDVTGYSANDALAILAENGFEGIVQKQVVDEELYLDVVYEMRPPAGTKLGDDEQVRLLVGVLSEESVGTGAVEPPAAEPVPGAGTEPAEEPAPGAG